MADSKPHISKCSLLWIFMSTRRLAVSVSIASDSWPFLSSSLVPHLSVCFPFTHQSPPLALSPLVLSLGLNGCVQSGCSSPGEFRLSLSASSSRSPLAGSTQASIMSPFSYPLCVSQTGLFNQYLPSKSFIPCPCVFAVFKAVAPCSSSAPLSLCPSHYSLTHGDEWYWLVTFEKTALESLFIEIFWFC